MKKQVFVLIIIVVLALFALTACEEGDDSVTGAAAQSRDIVNDMSNDLQEAVDQEPNEKSLSTFVNSDPDKSGPDSARSETDFFVELVSLEPDEPTLGDTVVLFFSYGNYGADDGYATLVKTTFFPGGGNADAEIIDFDSEDFRNGTQSLVLEHGKGEYGFIIKINPEDEDNEENVSNNLLNISFVVEDNPSTHKECFKGRCVVVDGVGENECTMSLECDYEEPVNVTINETVEELVETNTCKDNNGKICLENYHCMGELIETDDTALCCLGTCKKDFWTDFFPWLG